MLLYVVECRSLARTVDDVLIDAWIGTILAWLLGAVATRLF